MPNILDVICSEGSILDGLDDWSRSMTRNEWFRITRELVQQTIADLELDPEAMREVECTVVEYTTVQPQRLDVRKCAQGKSWINPCIHLGLRFFIKSFSV